MITENTYRWLLILGFASLTCIGMYYRVRSNSGEQLDRRQEGWFILVTLRLIALVWFAGLISYMINPAKLAFTAFGLPDGVRLFGGLLAVASTFLKVWTFHSLGTNLTDTVVTREQHALVTHGPYRFVRHPFYTSFAMDVVGISLLIANWASLVLGGAAMVILICRTSIEERKLIERFGDGYRDYMGTTGKYLPRLTTLK